jgi:GNAT superfamily N-acetyltransferase
MTSTINFTTQDESVTFTEVANLFESAGFGGAEFYLNDKEFETAFFALGTYRYFAFDDNRRLIGMVRVFSDNKICSWIAELCVHPAFRNQGVASGFLDLIIERSGHTAIYVEAFSGTESFYARRGIKPKARLVACGRAGKLKETSLDSKHMMDKLSGEKC